MCIVTEPVLGLLLSYPFSVSTQPPQLLKKRESGIRELYNSYTQHFTADDLLSDLIYFKGKAAVSSSDCLEMLSCSF